ncbi:MAG: glucose-phosphate adenylyltransferase [Candidatus Atribacteria bacterium]|nr:glucose-phosphate adenylyltransferase [Candidatus Atribacteria bacterium]
MYRIPVLAMVLAGGEGKRLDVLSEKRAKPAVPFGGKYRIIDFCLSNCVNSGIYSVGVLTQYNPRSLHDHIRTGKAWDLDRMNGGIFLLQPYISDEVTRWYRGTADAIYQNLRFVHDMNPQMVLILSGDHVYKMDYRRLVDFHIQHEADLTVSVIRVPWEEAHRFGILETDEQNRIISFEEKPDQPKSDLASMGIYLFKREVLEEEVKKEALKKETTFDFGKDILPRVIAERKVFAFLFKDYWKDVGTIDAYWEANMELLEGFPPLNLFDPNWPIYTPTDDRPPVKMGREAQVEKSILGSGAIINGKVQNSIIFGGVYLSEEAVVRDSIIMNDCFIGKNAILERVILDKIVRIEDNCRVGFDDLATDHFSPDVLKKGLTVIGKNSHLPANTVVGRNCRIGTDFRPQDFLSNYISSGKSLIKNEKEALT